MESEPGAAQGLLRDLSYGTAVFLVSFSRITGKRLHLIIFRPSLAVTLKFIAIVILHATVLSPTFGVSSLTLLIVLENAMGCKVFRDIKLDLSTSDGNLTNLVSRAMQFAPGAQQECPLEV